MLKGKGIIWMVVSAIVVLIVLVTVVLTFLLFTLGVSVCLVNGGEKAMETLANKNSMHIKNVTAITEIFGEGQKISAMALEYDAPINTAKLKISDFTVEGGNITQIYANTKAEKTPKGVNGNYVILELATPMIAQKMEGDSQSLAKHDENAESKEMHGPELGARPDRQAQKNAIGCKYERQWGRQSVQKRSNLSINLSQYC